MIKAVLRKEFLDKRKSLSPKQVMIATDLLLIQLQKLPLPAPEIILSYRPIADKQEIDMSVFESYLQLLNPSLTLCYPVSDIQNLTFYAVATDMNTKFAVNFWNIEEPVSNMVVSPKDIDLAFVPLLAFDKRGYRIGYGKGFYDRYLSQCRPDLIKIGYSYFPPVEEISDIDELDVPLNFGITPEEIYVF